MAELLTFGQAKVARELLKVSGCCGDSDEFASLLNQSVRKLMNRGPGERAWWGTTQKLQICSYENCITWPSYVSTPIAINIFNQWVPVRDQWASFMPFGRSDWNNAGGFRWYGGSCQGNVKFINETQSPVFRNIPCGKEHYIRVYPQSRQDVGKVITIFGIDSNGQVIRTLRSDGTYQDGVDVTIAIPFASTSFKLRTITRVLKPVTENVIRLFQYDADNDWLINCAKYYPNETSPSYRTSRISGMPKCAPCSQQPCDGLTNIQAIVKLEFIPVVSDSDLVLIENIDAIALMMQSIRALEGEAPSGAAAFEAAAIHELNLRLEDKFPIDQIPIQIAAFGTALPARAGIGRLY